jgi:hypothetical protein
MSNLYCISKPNYRGHKSTQITLTSAGLRSHLTECAILKVQSDIAETIDEGSTTAMRMIDLSTVLKSIIIWYGLLHSFGVKQYV